MFVSINRVAEIFQIGKYLLWNMHGRGERMSCCGMGTKVDLVQIEVSLIDVTRGDQLN